jgi:Tfp pilus assembly protein PilF
MLARVYLQQRLGIKAVEHLNEILKTDPGYADAYYELGTYYRETPARKAQVRTWYRRYLQLAPKGQYAPLVSTWLTANP